MTTKHTPGPWTIGDENNQHIEICIGDAVASLDRQDRYGMHMVFSREEMRANGHLIKAAPELLEALENIWVFLAEDDGEGSCATQYQSAIDKVKAAIAKAKGETP